MSLSTSSRRRLAIVAATSLLLGGLGTVVVAAPANAVPQTYTVDSTTDDGVGFTLRDAIDAANANLGFVDTINFDAALSGQTLEIDGVLIITEGLIIDGLGSANLSIERSAGNPTSDFFAFQPTAADQDLTISGITMSGDDVKTGSGVVVNDNFNTPRSVTLDDVTIDGMVTSLIGGSAVIVDGMTGVLNITNSSFVGNFGAGPGGAISAVDVGTAIFITDSEFIGNESDTDGGAVYIGSPTAFLTISGTDFDDNEANNTGGGGAVMVWAATIVSIGESTFESNIAYNAGGGMYVANVTSIEVSDSVFFNNTVTNNAGGGLYVGSVTGLVTIDSVTFSDNRSDNGGGLASFEGNDVVLEDSTFIDNYSDGDGGALYEGATSGSVSIERTTFEGNEAEGYGGAIYVDEVEADGSFTVHSSTFFDNIAGDAGASLAIPTIFGEVTVINSTLDERQPNDFSIIVATETGGDFRIRYSTIYGMVFIESNEGTSEILSSIVDGGGDPAVVVDFNDPADVSYSILTSPLVPANVNDLGGNQFSVADTKLGPLQDNGGPTFTRMPLIGSPAIDKGLPGGTPPTFDQRFTGFPRVIGGRVDVGSVETNYLPDTGAELNVVIPIVGGVLLLGGIAAVTVSAIRRRNLG